MFATEKYLKKLLDNLPPSDLMAADASGSHTAVSEMTPEHGCFVEVQNRKFKSVAVRDLAKTLHRVHDISPRTAADLSIWRTK